MSRRIWHKLRYELPPHFNQPWLLMMMVMLSEDDGDENLDFQYTDSEKVLDHTIDHILRF